MSLTRPPAHIVGRERELATLRHDLDTAYEGDGRLTLVSGESGIGKSALLAQIALEAEQRGFLVLTGAAYDHSSMPPYGPWLYLFENYPAIRKNLPELPGWLRPDFEDISLDSQWALFHDVYQFLTSTAASVPLLVILEDVHWADTGTLEMLRYIARRLHRVSLLVIASYRDNELSSDMPLFHLLPTLIRESGAERVQLERLDHEAIRQLVAPLYNLAPADEKRLTSYLHERAEGIPIFINELLRETVDERVLALRGDEWTLGRLDTVPVPPLVRQMVEPRLRRLDEDVRTQLSIAAVIGQEVPYNLWRQVSDTDDAVLEDVIEKALAASIMIQKSTGMLAFSHALVREAMQARIILPRRRNLHKKIAEALMDGPAQDQNCAAIAYHLQHARDSRAPRWLVRAGEQACSVYACETAIDALSAALEQRGSQDQLLDIRALRQRGLAYEIMGNFDLALDDHQTALRLAREYGNTHLVWQTMLELGTLWTARDYREAGEYFHQALELARLIGDEEMIAHSLNRIGNWNTNADRPAEGIACHREALKVFQRNADEHGIAATLDLLAMASYLHGDLPASKEYLRQAARRFREQNNQQALASVLPTLMLTHGSYDSDTARVASGSVEEALSYGEEGLNIARDIGWHAGTAYALIHIGYYHGLQARYNEALDLIRQGLELATNIAHREWITAGHSTLGIVLADMQATGPARAHLERAIASAKAMNSRFWIRTSAAGLAWVHMMEGRSELADALLDSVLEPHANVDSLGLRQCWFRRAELHLARNEGADALSIVDRLIERAPGDDANDPIPHLEWLRGRALLALERFEDAEYAFKRARGRAQQLSYRSLLWRVDLDHGQLLGKVGRADEALETFNRGRRQITEIAATINDADLSAKFRGRALGLFPDGGAHTGRNAGTSVLSPRETEVLRLVARGMTDADVGDQLHISPRTVGRHLQSIYNKLGVNSRTAATALALEQQLV